MTRGTAKTLAYFQNTRGIFLFIIEYSNYRPVWLYNIAFVKYIYNLHLLHILYSISLIALHKSLLFKKLLENSMKLLSNNIPSAL